MSHLRILLILILLLALVVAACDPEEDEDTEDEQDTATDVVVDEENQAADPICVANRFDIEGQGEVMWNIGGATGGSEMVLIDQDGNETSPDQLLQMNDERLNPVADIETQNVAIIVLDDFYAFAGEDFSHGEVVSLQIQQQIRSRQPYDFDPARSAVDDYPVLTWDPEDPQLPAMHIIEADTDFEITRVIDGLQGALAVAGSGLDVSRIAVNMSFAVIPCQITEDFDLRMYQQQIDESVEGEPIPRRTIGAVLAEDEAYMAPDTLEAVLGAPEKRFEEQIYSQLLALYERANSSGDADLERFHQVIQDSVGTQDTYWNPGERTVIYIAAAGNMGRNQECYIPGSWPEVVCTSASIIDDSANEVAWEGSNTGQTMTLGGFHWIIRNPPQSTDLAYIGTSFAAPVVTSNLAFYLTVETLCAGPPLDISLATFDDKPFREALASAGCAALN
ncbi:MAG: S8/S53 family peptidase [Chloroflexi bacterium]|nr:S8/S53 family peptidase [Chloroflexota bacterium]